MIAWLLPTVLVFLAILAPLLGADSRDRSGWTADPQHHDQAEHQARQTLR
jgi:hypothetical protein